MSHGITIYHKKRNCYKMQNTPLNITQFQHCFFQLTQQYGISWDIQGFINPLNQVFPIDLDTKVISTVFERLSSPVICSIAQMHGYIVDTANQTTYPDFTLTKYDHLGQVVHRIALDIKSTYIEPNPNVAGHFKKTRMTLGSYNSFIRNDTKNIRYPYHTYNEHWVLGFVYLRNLSFQEYTLDNIPQRGDITCPYSVQSVFIRDKVDITGIRAGSGNTKNIGSVEIETPNGFEIAHGPFTSFGPRKKEACDYYWSNYEDLKGDITDITTLNAHPSMRQFRTI